MDDVLVTGNSPTEIQLLKDSLHAAFTIKDLGLARYFLGMELYRDDSGVYLSQREYIRDILTDCQMENARVANFPLPTELKLRLDEGELLNDVERYRRLIGRLLYLSLTRPDLSYSVQHLSQFVSQPRMPHWQVVVHVLRYLKGTPTLGLFYPMQTSLNVTGFTDADWGSCLTTRRSLYGYCVFLGHTLVSWKTKKQTTVARSLAEAKYRSMANTTTELVWTSYLLRDLCVPIELPITLFCDNQAAQQLVANPCFHERTKHVDLDCLTRERIQSGFLQTAYIPTNLQLADLMTKALGQQQHTFLSSKLGIKSAPT